MKIVVCVKQISLILARTGDDPQDHFVSKDAGFDQPRGAIFGWGVDRLIAEFYRQHGTVIEWRDLNGFCLAAFVSIGWLIVFHLFKYCTGKHDLLLEHPC